MDRVQVSSWEPGRARSKDKDHALLDQPVSAPCYGRYRVASGRSGPARYSCGCQLTATLSNTSPAEHSTRFGVHAGLLVLSRVGPLLPQTQQIRIALKTVGAASQVNSRKCGTSCAFMHCICRSPQPHVCCWLVLFVPTAKRCTNFKRQGVDLSTNSASVQCCNTWPLSMRNLAN